MVVVPRSDAGVEGGDASAGGLDEGDQIRCMEHVSGKDDPRAAACGPLSSRFREELLDLRGKGRRGRLAPLHAEIEDGKSADTGTRLLLKGEDLVHEPADLVAGADRLPEPLFGDPHTNELLQGRGEPVQLGRIELHGIRVLLRRHIDEQNGRRVHVVPPQVAEPPHAIAGVDQDCAGRFREITGEGRCQQAPDIAAHVRVRVGVTL